MTSKPKKPNAFEAAKNAAVTNRVPDALSGRALAEELTHFSTRITPTLKKELKRLAVEEGTGVQDLTMEALTDLLEKRQKS